MELVTYLLPIFGMIILCLAALHGFISVHVTKFDDRVCPECLGFPDNGVGYFCSKCEAEDPTFPN